MLNRSPQDSIRSDFIAAVEDATLTYAEGEQSYQWWVDTIRQLLALYARRLTLAAFGQTTPDSAQLARAWWTVHSGYFMRWAAQIEDRPPEAVARERYRLTLYADAGTSLAERAQSRALGLPDLPFYPALWTRCRMRCRCRWRYVPVRDGYDCYWTLGAAEHCPTCLVRASVCNPLQVRNGAIVNPERYTAIELYA